MINNFEAIKQLFFNSVEDCLILIKLIHENKENFSQEQRDQLKSMITMLMSELLVEEKLIVTQ